MADDLLEKADSGEDQGLATDQSEAEDQELTDSDDPLAGEEDLQKAFLSLYQECTAEDRYPRLIEVKDVKQAENYWAGRQYWYWSDRDEQWKQAPGVGVSPLGDLDFDEMPRFEFVTNIYQSKGLIQIGAVAGAPPRIRFFPDDADNPDDIETAEGRTKEAKLIERWNPPQLSLQKEMYAFYTGGICVWWTHYLEDGERLGFDQMDTLGEGSVDVDSTIHCPQCGWSAPAAEAEPPVPCPQCGAQLTEDDISQEEPIPLPSDTGQTDVPRGRQVIEILGALNFKRPQHTDEQAQWHYCAIERETHYCILRANAPTKAIADAVRPGMNFGPDDAFERNARLSVAENAKLPTQTGAKQSVLVTHANVWFRPSAYWMMKDETLRDKAREIAPHGINVQFAGTTFYRSQLQSMDDCLVTKHALPGRGQHRPAVGTAMMSVQDRFNTFSNISAETYEYGIPITYRAADTFASEADEEQRAAPGLEVEVAIPIGADIRQRIMQVRADSVSPDMHQHMMELAGPIAEEMTGSYQAVSGSAEQSPETLGQESMRRDQAMGRLGVFYVNLKQARAEILTLACKDYEAHAEGKVNMPVLGDSGDFENEAIDISALQGDATAYPEGDENFPELWNQQRATAFELNGTPQGAALQQDMGNAQVFCKLIGIPDLKVPGQDAWQAQLQEISQLTKIPEDEELLSGIAPEVEVDSDDEHAIHSQCCKWWLNSPQHGRKMKRDNPLGWMAVKQHKAQHDAAIPKPMPEEKPLSETFSAAFKDLPPEAQAQILEKWGIQVTPQDFMDQIQFEKAKKPAPRPMIPPGNGAPEKRLNA